MQAGRLAYKRTKSNIARGPSTHPPPNLIAQPRNPLTHVLQGSIVSQKFAESITLQLRNSPLCARSLGDNRMEKKLFAELMASVKEMKAVRAGRKKPSRRFVVEPAYTKVPAIRRALRLSQTEFAAMLGISVKTLRHWEQGLRSPDGPARALLTIAAKNPRAVLEALHPQTIAG